MISVRATPDRRDQRIAELEAEVEQTKAENARFGRPAGAAGVMIGPRAKALAADLKHRLGVPFAKICAVLAVGLIS